MSPLGLVLPVDGGRLERATARVYSLRHHGRVPICQLLAVSVLQNPFLLASLHVLTTRATSKRVNRGSSRSRCSVYCVQPSELAPQTRSEPDRKSTRLNSSHANISYDVFCSKKKKNKPE